ncbi:MAG: hypothetical protein M0R46_11505 [Candidatus Muirbacterium halophilum]|nr:hypothetical protein [Candidatus Muirbacterium halophilum]
MKVKNWKQFNTWNRYYENIEYSQDELNEIVEELIDYLQSNYPNISIYSTPTIGTYSTDFEIECRDESTLQEINDDYFDGRGYIQEIGDPYLLKGEIENDELQDKLTL